MGILSWAVFGLIVGAIAKLLMPGDDPGGCLVTMALGIVGSVVGGYVGTMLGLYPIGVSAGGIVMSVVGAMLVLIVYRAVVGR